MAFKLSKTEQATIDTLLGDVSVAADAIDAAEKAYNAALADLGQAVKAAIQTYNTKIATLRTYVTDVAQEHRNTYNDKSERFQEGDAGTKVSQWLDALDERVGEIEDIDPPDSPEPITLEHPVWEDFDIPADPDSV